MYTPPKFDESDPSVLLPIMRENDFALLISQAEDGPMVTHLPLAVDTAAAGGVTITGHMARANPHWRLFEPSGRALAVFTGPHAYVSPGWYRTSPAVPTWNYVAVHAHGEIVPETDPDALEDALAAMVRSHEAGQERPWRFAPLPADYRARKLKGIVGFRMTVDRLEGKLKLSQDRPPEDAARVAATLEASPSQGDREVAAAMRRLGVRKAD